MEYLSVALTVGLFAAVGSAAYAALFGAPWVPTRQAERKSLAELADLAPGEKFYDLGSGTGTILFDLARSRPDVEFVGVEISLLPYLYSKARQLLGARHYRNVKIFFRDLYRFDISAADAVFVFLVAKRHQVVAQKLAHEAKPTCRIIVEAWPIEGIEPLKTQKTEKSLSLFLYRGDQF
jgi:SAM-dependent methyltransferase